MLHLSLLAMSGACAPSEYGGYYTPEMEKGLQHLPNDFLACWPLLRNLPYGLPTPCTTLVWPWAVTPDVAKVSALACPPVLRLSYGWSIVPHQPYAQRRGCLDWTISRAAVVASTEAFLSTARPIGWWICYRNELPKRLRPGCRVILALRSSRVIGPPNMLVV